jgi:hypothetical protein
VVGDNSLIPYSLFLIPYSLFLLPSSFFLIVRQAKECVACATSCCCGDKGRERPGVATASEKRTSKLPTQFPNISIPIPISISNTDQQAPTHATKTNKDDQTAPTSSVHGRLIVQRRTHNINNHIHILKAISILGTPFLLSPDALAALGRPMMQVNTSGNLE